MEQYFPIILIALFAVVLFVLPARQRKRQQAQAQALQESLAIGTPVMTTAGLHGSVAGIGRNSNPRVQRRGMMLTAVPPWISPTLMVV